jgi:3-methyladenine DNA glycosylase AlkD
LLRWRAIDIINAEMEALMDTIRLSPESAAAKILKSLEAMANPERARQVQRYFRETVRSYGVPSPAMRALAKEIQDATKGEWTIAEAAALCGRLLPRPELEAKGVASLLLLRHHREFTPPLFATIHGWLAKDYLSNWASVDLLCPPALGILLGRYPELLRRIETWAAHPNRWVRRASLVAFLKLAKRAEYADAAYAMAARHFSSRDDLVQKAAGWLLRETGKRDMARLEIFLMERGSELPRTTLRYAIERFPEGKRRRLLLKTRL